METIRECIEQVILPWARIACELGGMAPEAAIDHACRTVISAARDATLCTGSMMAEAIEQHAFARSVACDVLTGTHRPSVGNARTYALNNI